MRSRRWLWAATTIARWKASSHRSNSSALPAASPPWRHRPSSAKSRAVAWRTTRGTFGYILFQAVGGYIAAVVVLGPSSGTFQQYVFGARLPFGVALLLATVAGAILSLLIGLFSLRNIRRDYQAASEFAHMTVFENLVTAGHGARGSSLRNVVLHRNETRQAERVVTTRAWSVLDRFEMLHVADLYGAELSGGQRRLVEIMRCLMREPKGLLLDEPMVGVAPHLVEKLLGDLRSIRDEGIALVVVEHALEVVQELCGRVVVMALGRPIASGSFDAVVAGPEVQARDIGLLTHVVDDPADLSSAVSSVIGLLTSKPAPVHAQIKELLRLYAAVPEPTRSRIASDRLAFGALKRSLAETGH